MIGATTAFRLSANNLLYSVHYTRAKWRKLPFTPSRNPFAVRSIATLALAISSSTSASVKVGMGPNGIPMRSLLGHLPIRPRPVAETRTTHGKHMDKAVVLVVENQALIRISTLHMIEDAGFAVAGASHADEAVDILENRSDIRAVFTDIKIPGSIDGYKLARAIRGRWPPIHLILTSALPPDTGELPANGLFIQKPYTAEHVSAALYELFSHDPASRAIVRDTGWNRAMLA